MRKPSNDTTLDAERRARTRSHRPVLAGVPVRADDIEPTRGLHSIAILFRVLAGLLGLIIVLQIVNGVTSLEGISYGVLLAEVIRLVVFAGLLWAAGELADLFVTSHHDLRSMRILLARLNHQAPGGGVGRADHEHIDRLRTEETEETETNQHREHRGHRAQ
jgi:hypothetical protein